MRMALLRRAWLLACALCWLPGCGSDSDGASGGSASASAGGEGGSGADGSVGQGAGSAGTCAGDGDCTQADVPPCWVSVCNTGQLPGPTGKCFFVPDNEAACDDGRFCTLGDTCSEGSCVGAPNTCGLETDACHTVACDDDTRTCTPQAAANGDSCVSDDPCVENATCSDGQCVGPPKQCPPGGLDPCFSNICNPATGLCETLPDPSKDGDYCVSADLCTFSASCLDGACVGGFEQDCSYLDQACMAGFCDPATGFCEAAAVPAGGACAPADAACNAGVCDASGDCQPIPFAEGTPCSDGDACTNGEACSAGQCVGGVTSNQEVYFEESFASNAAGWQLGTEWEIGPATASIGISLGPDPGIDHSAGDDNGVAGVVLGGDTAPGVHPHYFLTSPPIDVSAAAGPVYLELWRWLNSDSVPFMENSIDVWNGSAWVTVWTSDDFLPITDFAWTKQVYDLTLYKNAALQVRFGYAVVFDTFPVSGWNIDDVRLLNQSCD
jgi:hypothetical protein